MREVAWRGLESGTLEICRVRTAAEGVAVHSVITGAFGTLGYELHAGPDWSFRSVRLTLGERALDVTRRGGDWFVDGNARPDLRGAAEVDIAATPLTNTLPISRLALGVGTAADIATAYIAVPELSVTLDPQRYTRLAPARYLYESRDTPFSAAVTVDDDGLVLDYPGLFERIG